MITINRKKFSLSSSSSSSLIVICNLIALTTILLHLVICSMQPLVEADGSTVGTSIGGKKETTKDELFRITRLLYGSRFMSPKKTLKYLHQIEGSKFDNFRARNFIEMNEITDAKCKKNKLEEFDYNDNGLLQLDALRPYLASCKKRQIDHCRKTFNERLLEAVKRFNDEDLADIELLSHDIQMPNKLLQSIGIINDIGFDHIRDKAVNYLMAKEKILRNKGLKFEYFDELYDELEKSLLDTCRRVNKVLGSFLYLYNRVTLKRGLEDSVVGWMQVARTCHKLLSNSELTYQIHNEWERMNSSRKSQVNGIN